MTAPERISALATEIEFRVQAIRGAQPDWPCRKGCDTCCRRLAALPRLTPPEWQRLCEGLDLLPRELLATIAHKVRQTATRPVVCPLLDDATGACRVYAYRPIACRTYGYYVERDKGLYCAIIEARVDAGETNSVVWGNHESVDARLAACGEPRSLADWMATYGSTSRP